MEYIMKKVLVAMIVVLAANGAHADTQTDHAIIGTLLGGFIGYQIAKATEPRTVPVPQGVPIYQDPRVSFPHVPRCWNRLDRINQYGQPIYMQECR
jgi:hypothetical protein